MAKLYSTGPVLIFTNALNTGPAYFGTGQQAPDIQTKPEWEQVMNDLGGTRVPFDRCYEDAEAITSVVINRYNEAQLEAMMSRPDTDLSTAGSTGSGEIGTLMGQEGMLFTVWLMFPYAPKPYQTSDAVSGYRFPGSMLFGPENIKGGTKDKTVSLTWQHQRVFSVAPGAYVTGVGAVPGVGSFVLYDHNMAGLPAIN